MQIYWIKAQAPRRVLALLKHLGLDAECIEIDMMAGGLKRPVTDRTAVNNEITVFHFGCESSAPASALRTTCRGNLPTGDLQTRLVTHWF